MKVMKFGGTSVGSPGRMKEVARLCTSQTGKKLIVLSALSGTTNSLVEIGNLLALQKKDDARAMIQELEKHYRIFIEKLFAEKDRTSAVEAILENFEFLNIILKISYSESIQKDILAQGELLSTKLFSEYLRSRGTPHLLLPALEFMQLNEEGEPAMEKISHRLRELIKVEDIDIYITQGFITKNHKGEVDNLKRGGSDYTASIIAAVLNADVCEIWTDISGMHNNDPRVVEGTHPVEQLSFEEAAELAYFGAKILHPASILPARLYNIPVRLLNTMEPEAKGTMISSRTSGSGVKAIAAKDNITSIRIISGRMLLAYGFLRRVFEIFENFRTPIDMITTSEVAVSLTIDSDFHLSQIISELKKLGTVDYDQEQTIVAVVGDNISVEPELKKRIFSALSGIPVRMVSYGGSPNNISILISQMHKSETLRALNRELFARNS